MSTYPHLVELLTIGKSSEGLPLRVVRVSTSEELQDPLYSDPVDNNLIGGEPDRIGHYAGHLAGDHAGHYPPDPRPEPKRRRPRPHQRPLHRNRTARTAGGKKPAVWIDGGEMPQIFRERY